MEKLFQFVFNDIRYFIFFHFAYLCFNTSCFHNFIVIRIIIIIHKSQCSPTVKNEVYARKLTADGSVVPPSPSIRFCLVFLLFFCFSFLRRERGVLTLNIEDWALCTATCRRVSILAKQMIHRLCFNFDWIVYVYSLIEPNKLCVTNVYYL